MNSKRLTVRMLGLMMSFSALVLFGSTSVWAVYAPEPQSGGRFFNSKGTRSANEYQYMGRTGNRQYEDYLGKGYQYEMLHLKPYAGYTGEWDTNVFLEDDDTDQDYINRLNWGLDAEVPMEDGKYVLGGGVHSESEWFAEHSSENHTDWIYQGSAEMNFNSFSVALFEEFRDTSSRADSELTTRTERNENYLDALITIPFGEFFQETEVSHYNLEFDDSTGMGIFDRQEFRVIPRVGINVGDRTQVLTEYDWTHIDYDTNNDRNGMAHQLAAGVRGFLGAGDLVTYQAWAGWQFRNYNSDLRDDFSGFVFRSDVEYRRTEFSRFAFEIHRAPVESVTTNNSYIVRNELAARWRRQISERLSGELRGGLGFYDYSDGRLDFYWEPKVKLDYLLPGNFARLFTEYRFSGRNSDVSDRDYARHLLNAGIRFEV